LQNFLEAVATAMTIEARLAVATQLIREAGDLAAGFFARRETLTRETKGPQDFVSIADREVEVLIRTRLAEAFQHDGFLGEESGEGRGSAAGSSIRLTGPTISCAAFPCGVSRSLMRSPASR
jgi:fructose-1,6-bisphosphatase/inositol monophosphatase family enzyme